MLGTTLGGRYLMEGLLGRGGMGEVWRARDLELDRVVAVKVMASGASDVAVARFRREMEACARMHHPNVVRLYDAGVRPDGAPYCVIELLEGQGLDAVLADRTRLDPDEALSLMRGMAAALEHAHGCGVVHRDLKPANVFVVPGRGAVLLDFGLARLSDRTQLTKTGSYLGTPLYTSPEMARGERVDERSDLWQVGVMAYEMLTGRNPFMGETFQVVVAAIMKRRPAPPSTVVPGLAGGWDVVVDGCLAKTPEGRYAAAAALGADLARLAQGGSPSGPRERDRVAAGPGRPTPPPGLSDQGRAGRVASRWYAVIAVVGVVLALALASLDRFEGGGGGDGVRELTLTAGWERARIRWTSDEACLGAVEVLEPFRRVVRADGGPTTDHEVLVEGLPRDAAFEYRVLLPSGGEGLPQRGRTTAPALVVTTAALEQGGLALAWEGCPPAGMGQVEGEGRVTVEAAAGGGRLRVAGDPRRLRDVRLPVTGPLGERVVVSLAACLTRQTESAVSALRAYDPGATVAAMQAQTPRQVDDALDSLGAGAGRTPREQESAKAQVAAFRAHVARGGVLDRHRAAAAYAPAAFETGLLSVETRRALAVGLEKLVIVEAYARGRGVYLELAPRPWLGDYGMSAVGRFEPGRVLRVRGGDEAPLRLGTGPPLGPAGCIGEWVGRVVVDEDEAAGRCELAVELRRLERTTLSVEVGSGPPVIIHDLDVGAVHADAAPRVVFAGVPEGSLSPGSNPVVLRFLCLYDQVGVREANVGAVSLRIPGR